MSYFYYYFCHHYYNLLLLNDDADDVRSWIKITYLENCGLCHHRWLCFVYPDTVVYLARLALIYVWAWPQLCVVWIFLDEWLSIHSGNLKSDKVEQCFLASPLEILPALMVDVILGQRRQDNGNSPYVISNFHMF